MSNIKLNFSRRRWLAVAATSFLVLPLGNVWAAPVVVEVIAFAHPPVVSALKPLRDWLSRQGGKLRVIEIDMETPAAERRLQSVGLKGHVPIVILIDGQYRHMRQDGSAVEFVSFPASPGTPPGAKSAWSPADVEAVLKPRLQ